TVGAAGPNPAGQEIVELALLRCPGLQSGPIPVGGAVMLGEGTAVDDGPRRKPQLLRLDFESYPLPGRRQGTDPQSLSRVFFAPRDQVRTPVAPMIPGACGVPLEHDLLGRIEGIEEDVHKQRVSLADLEPLAGVLEEPLLGPRSRDSQGRLAA